MRNKNLTTSTYTYEGFLLVYLLFITSLSLFLLGFFFSALFFLLRCEIALPPSIAADWKVLLVK